MGRCREALRANPRGPVLGVLWGRPSREADQPLNMTRSGQRKRHGHREKLPTWFIPFSPVVPHASGWEVASWRGDPAGPCLGERGMG